jgi:hypothetical protein
MVWKERNMEYPTISDSQLCYTSGNLYSDGYSVLCIFKHVLQQIKIYFPKVMKNFNMSINAACYSSANVIAGKAAISKKMGVNLLRTEFNVPQRGKDQCDRNSAVITTRIKSFLNSGNDMCSAEQIYNAIISFGGKLKTNFNYFSFSNTTFFLPRHKEYLTIHNTNHTRSLIYRSYKR